MASKFTIVSIRPTAGGYGIETDLSALRVCNLKYAEFQPVADDKDKPSKIRVRHKADMPGLDLSEGYRWAAGWRDRDSKVWDNTREVYAGYVQKQTGRATGQLKIIDQDLTGFNCLTTRSKLDRTWPDPEDYQALYPLYYSMRDWLIGTRDEGKPYDGIMRQVLGGYAIDWSGVDPFCDRIIFDEAVAPGAMITEAPQRGRAFGFMMLNAVIEEILEAARFIDLSIDPVAYFDCVVNPNNPTEIIPRFCVKDRNARDGASVATYASNPVPGEWQIEQPFTHERDWTEVATNIDVKSSDFEDVGGGNWQLIWARAYDPEFSARYQTTWQTLDGWASVFVDESIPTIAECRALATTQMYIRRDAQGRIRFRSSHFSPVGSIITLNVPEEGQNYAQHRVTDCFTALEIGRPMWDIVVGEDVPDSASIFRRQSKKLTALWQVQTILRAGGNAGNSTTGVPQTRPITTNPTHSGQNTVQATSDTAVGMTFKPGYVPPDGTPSETPAYQVTHVDQYGNLMDWQSADGAAPARIGMDFSKATTITWLADENGIITRMLIDPPTLGVTMTVRGIAPDSLPDIYSPGVLAGDPPLLQSAGEPVLYLEGDSIAVTTDGPGQVSLSHRAARVFPT